MGKRGAKCGPCKGTGNVMIGPPSLIGSRMECRECDGTGTSKPLPMGKPRMKKKWVRTIAAWSRNWKARQGARQAAERKGRAK